MTAGRKPRPTNLISPSMRAVILLIHGIEEELKKYPNPYRDVRILI